MNALRGWCPSLFEPMRSGDGLLVRVKPRLAALSTTQAMALAEAAQRHGNGWLELTNRANWQIRGLQPETVEPFTRAMLAAGLADPDPGVERRRNLQVPPLLGLDPGLPSDLPVLAEALQSLLAEAALEALPGKFGLLLEDGAQPQSETDLHLRLTPIGVALRLPGGDFQAITAEAVEAARALLQAFLRLAPQLSPQPRRMRGLVQALGAPAIFAAAGLPCHPAPRTAAAKAPPPVGFQPYAGQDRGALGLGLPFGQMQAAQLSELAARAEALGVEQLRVTGRRALLLPGLSASQARALAASCAGLITDPADPRLAILTCPGRQGCASGSTETRTDAQALAARPLPGLLHLSGCAKGCAHPGTALVTLVAQDGSYALVRNGRAGDPPVRTGLTLAQAMAILEKR